MDKRKATLEQVQVEYERHCLAKGLSPETVLNYSGLLRIMHRTLGNITVWNLSHTDVDRLFAAQTWSPGSRNNRLNQLRTFLAWCRARGYMHRDNDPTFGWSMLTVPNQNRQRIPFAEWPRLFDACIHPQETIVLATGLYLFLRSSEQKLIQLKHVHLADAEIEIYRPKVKRWDVMPISAELHGYLSAHMTSMAERGWSDPEHYLIGRRGQLARHNHKWVQGTGDMFHDAPLCRPFPVVQRILTRAGYPSFQEGEHTLRRSGARAYFDALLEQGFDGAMRRVQSMLGHKHSTMTERYLGLDLDRVRRNQDLRGKPMFPATQSGNIVQMVRRVGNG